jgi:DNA polymerase III alpha subunit|tara:strand:+ start:827 stop:1591 length:765 start_codon:yes stop_codon:yes gene_type:complete
MIPVFKSTFSIGRSILTLNKEETEGGPNSIMEICKEHSIDPLVLVEDSMTGFVTAHNRCKEAGIKLLFGLRITCCNNTYEDDDSDHKIIIFAKNDEGCRLLYKIYSYAHTGQSGKVDFPFLFGVWNENIELVIPFYDSFIFNNNFHFKKCVPDFSTILPTFWTEMNDLPFDPFLAEKVEKFARSMMRPVKLVKTILYKNREDVEALQTYKILCNRNFGKAASLSSPNLNHFGSKEFCFQSYLSQKHSKHERTPS